LEAGKSLRTDEKKTKERGRGNTGASNGGEVGGQGHRRKEVGCPPEKLTTEYPYRNQALEKVVWRD